MQKANWRSNFVWCRAIVFAPIFIDWRCCYRHHKYDFHASKQGKSNAHRPPHKSIRSTHACIMAHRHDGRSKRTVESHLIPWGAIIFVCYRPLIVIRQERHHKTRAAKSFFRNPCFVVALLLFSKPFFTGLSYQKSHHNCNYRFSLTQSAHLFVYLTHSFHISHK